VSTPALTDLARLRLRVEQENHETLLATVRAHRAVVANAQTEAQKFRREAALHEVERLALSAYARVVDAERELAIVEKQGVARA
jgi:hypothetical protein